MKTTPLLAAIGALALPVVALGQTATYEAIPMAATAIDMTPDGRYIVGASDLDENGSPDGAYLYDCLTGTHTVLAASSVYDASGISDDGSVIVGCMPDPGDGVQVAAMWTSANGWQPLGWLPDALNCPSRSNGYDVSADGTTVVGLSWDGCSGRGFVWTQATGMLELEPMANGGNRATTISADGTVIGGFAQGSFSRTPAMWDGVTTDGMLLDPPSGDVVGEVLGTNEAGTILLGNWDGDAYMWTEDEGVQVIGNGSVAPSWVGYAMDIADNGVAVGFDGLLTNRRAWIHEPGDEVLTALNTWVTAHGGVLPPGESLGVATNISDDGTVIIGHTFFGSAWKITIEWPDCPGDIDGGGAVDFGDLLQILSGWGTDGPGADLAEPLDVIDFNDLLIVLSNWGPCS